MYKDLQEIDEKMEVLSNPLHLYFFKEETKNTHITRGDLVVQKHSNVDKVWGQ